MVFLQARETSQPMANEM